MFYTQEQEDEANTPLATMDDAVSEWARNVNAPEDVEWLSHDWDVWVKNPYFTGTPGPHPEDDYDRGDEDDLPDSLFPPILF